jgi:YgiT-type zinc finger domain-containing protein
MPSKFGYRCEYCEGTVRSKHIAREAFKHKSGFVILENVEIGVCDKCGNRYFTADTLRRVQDVASGKIPPEHTEQVPVAREG